MASIQNSGETKEGKDEEIDPDAAPFKIHTINAVCFWQNSGDFEDCAICRFTLSGPSVQYLANPSPAFNSGLKLAFGSCGHVFHMDCLNKWQKTRKTCPYCNQEWDLIRVEIIPGEEHSFFGNDN